MIKKLKDFLKSQVLRAIIVALLSSINKKLIVGDYTVTLTEVTTEKLVIVVRFREDELIDEIRKVL